MNRNRSAMVAIASCWTTCMVYAAALTLNSISSCGENFCMVPDEVMFHVYVMLFSILPVVSSTCLSLYLFYTVRALRQKDLRLTAHGSSNCNGLGGSMVMPQDSSRSLRTYFFLFTVTAWVTVTWLPARAHYIFLLEDTSNWAAWFGLVTNYVLLLTPMVNPLLTILVDANYRKFAKKTLLRLQKHYKFFSGPVNTATATQETFLWSDDFECKKYIFSYCLSFVKFMKSMTSHYGFVYSLFIISY